MNRFAALLRAVNVGGTGKMPMAALRDVCAKLGFQNPKTLLASGNVVFETDLPADTAQLVLSDGIQAHFGINVGVFLITPDHMHRIYRQNPFPDHSASQVGVLFVDEMPDDLACAHAKNRKDEIIVRGEGVLYIKFPAGMGQSRLIAPGSATGTMRNMNTVAKLESLLNA